MSDALFLDRKAQGTLICRLDESVKDVVRVVVSGEIDLATAPSLAEALDDAFVRGVLLVLDLREVSFCDSSGLHLVVCADRRARESGRRLVIVRGPRQVHQLLVLTHLDAHLEIIDDPGVVVGQARS